MYRAVVYFELKIKEQIESSFECQGLLFNYSKGTIYVFKSC